MDYRDAVLREDAIEWLLANHREFPASVRSEAATGISHPVFAGWRWVRTPIAGVILANGIQRPITRDDFNERKTMTGSHQ